MTLRIGVFIDADNIHVRGCEKALSVARKMGDVQIIRGYGNWSSKGGAWKKLVNDFGIIACHRYSLVATPGKNAADISLAVDATAAMHTTSVDVIAIVSSDADFTPVAQYARSQGKIVLGFGSAKAPSVYTGQCSLFINLDADAAPVVQLKTA